MRPLIGIPSYWTQARWTYWDMQAAVARRRALPVLAICRGMQLLNVERGGDLVQHLADVIDMEPHRPAPGVFGTHEVTIAPGSRAHELLGGRASVQSAHHQGIGRVGAGLEPSAHASDGTIEALEDPHAPFCIGVLWHPDEEALEGGAPLFRGLVDAARAYAERGATRNPAHLTVRRIEPAQ